MTQDIKYDFSLDSDLSAIECYPLLNNRGYEKYLHMHVLYYYRILLKHLEGLSKTWRQQFDIRAKLLGD